MDVSNKTVCIICTEKKPKEEFNIEHIFPSAIGGAITIHNVCKNCNSNLGVLVDQPFLAHGMIAYYRNVLQISRNDNRRKQNIPSPFKVPVVTVGGKQFKMSFKESKPTMEIIEELTFDEDPDTGELVAKLTIPSTKLDQTDAILKKLAKRQGYEISEYRVGHKEIKPYPAVKAEIPTENNTFIRGCVKIGYEAFLYFFPDFIDDEVCKLIRSTLTATEIDPAYRRLLQRHHSKLMSRYHEIIPKIGGISLHHHAFLIENVEGVGIVCCVRIFNWFYPVIVSNRVCQLPKGCSIFVCNHAVGRRFESNLKHRYENIRLNVDLVNVSDEIQMAVRKTGEQRFHRENGTLPIYENNRTVKYRDPMELCLSIMQVAERYFPWHAPGFNIDLTRQNLYVRDISGAPLRLLSVKTDRQVIFDPLL